jgi:hypothetical protein
LSPGLRPTDVTIGNATNGMCPNNWTHQRTLIAGIERRSTEQGRRDALKQARCR